MELDVSDIEASNEDLEELSGDELDELEELEESDSMAASRKNLADLIEGAKATSQSESGEKASGKTYNRGKGVVYLSRVPPMMSPNQLRGLLSPYGEVGRVWLEVPEAIAQDKSLSEAKIARLAKRVAKEGWVEFERAKKAYKAAKLLHCQPMGEGRFKHDLWSIKYLKNFSWSDLVNQHLHRKKMRESRLRQSLTRAKQEATKYLENRNKQEDSEKRKKRPREDSQGEKAKTVVRQNPAPSSSEPGALSTDLLSKVRILSITLNVSHDNLCSTARTHTDNSSLFDCFLFSSSWEDPLSLQRRRPS